MSLVCPWKVQMDDICIIESVTQKFMVKPYMAKYTCQIAFKNKRATTNWLAKFHCISSMKLANLKTLIKEYLKLEVNECKVRRENEKVLKMLQGQMKEEFGMLLDYLGEVTLVIKLKWEFLNLLETNHLYLTSATFQLLEKRTIKWL